MNKLIKELTEKAGFVLWGNEEWGPGKGHVDWSCDYKDALVKYTELIVRECAGVAEKERLYQTSDLIKKHFGVEV